MVGFLFIRPSPASSPNGSDRIANSAGTHMVSNTVLPRG